jgi:hypothetical protein
MTSGRLRGTSPDFIEYTATTLYRLCRGTEETALPPSTLDELRDGGVDGRRGCGRRPSVDNLAIPVLRQRCAMSNCENTTCR